MRRWGLRLAVLACIAAGFMVWPVRVRADRVPPRVDAIVVLHSGNDNDTTLGSTSIARLNAGIAMAHTMPSALIVLTRSIYRRHGIRYDATPDQRRRIAAAGLSDRWRLTDSAANTWGEATVSARLLLPGRSNIAVVTSPSHTVRACATFEHAGFRVTCIADVEPRRSLWFAAYLNVYEHAAYIEYWLRGYVRRRG